MKKPSAHAIDEDAIDLFKSSLPKARWQIYDIGPDYAKDNIVELIEGGCQTGKIFCVQLKGQRRVNRLSDGTVSFSLETTHLDYWTTLDIPVFLVVVDLTLRAGYWLFIQKYVHTDLHGLTWKAKKHITVHLPSSNLLTDHIGLRKAVECARVYMTNLAFHAAMSEEKQELEKLDPRVRVEIQWTPEYRHYILHSDKPIPLSFSSRTGPQGSAKIGELLDGVLPVSTSLSEIRVNGSPAFSSLLERAGNGAISLQFKRNFKGHINILRQTAEGNELGRFDAIPCTFSLGRKKAFIEAKLPHTPELFAITLAAAPHRGEITSISMPVNLSAWVGHAMMDLPFFEPLASIFHAYEARERLTLECFIPGSRVLSGQIKFLEQPPYPGVDLCISILQKARAICRLKGINPLLPGNYNQGSTLREIDELYAILLGPGQASVSPDAKLSVSMLRDGVEDFLRESKRRPKTGEFKLAGDGEFPFLGGLVKVLELEQVVSHVRMVTDLPKLRKALIKFPRKQEFRLDFAATSASKTVVRSKQHDPIG
jgi:Domain of unknown function (DUF4365)